MTITTWNTDAAYHGADFAFSNGNLDAAGSAGTIGIAVDLDNNKIWARPAGGAWSGASGNPATNTGGNSISSVNTGAVMLAWSGFDASAQDQGTLNTGATPFQVPPPSGFSAWDATGATTWDSGNKGAGITLSNGNMTAKATTSSTW